MTVRQLCDQADAEEIMEWLAYYEFKQEPPPQSQGEKFAAMQNIAAKAKR